MSDRAAVARGDAGIGSVLPLQLVGPAACRLLHGGRRAPFRDYEQVRSKQSIAHDLAVLAGWVRFASTPFFTSGCQGSLPIHTWRWTTASHLSPNQNATSSRRSGGNRAEQTRQCPSKTLTEFWSPPTFPVARRSCAMRWRYCGHSFPQRSGRSSTGRSEAQ